MRAPRELRAWLVVTAALVAVASGQSHDHEHEGPPGPFGHHGEHGEGTEGFHDKPAICSSEQTKDAVQASSNYVECAGLEYADFMSLVHADIQILQDAAACFKGKVEEIKPDVAPGENMDKTEEEVKEMNARLDKALDECVDAAKKADDTHASQATTDFLEKMLGPDSKVCTCFPAFVDKMPECESWSRFHHFGLRLEELCTHASGGISMLPGPVEVKEEEEGEVLPAEEETPEAALPEEAKVVEPEPASAAAEGEGEGDHPPHLPNTWGPCPPGQVPHPDDPKDCQPAVPPAEELDAPQGENDGSAGPPPSGGGGELFGLGMSVLGVVAVGGVIGFGGVWAWSKFSSGTRQPGVRYMAAGMGDDNLGTELGPFGREYGP